MAAPLGATPAQVPEPVAVVSPQFCVPHMVPLTVTKTDSAKEFTVTDANGGVVLQVIEGTSHGIHHRRVLRDAAGQPILTLQDKALSMHHRWEVFRGDSKNESDLLFTTKISSLWNLKTKLDVFLASNTAQKVCDFKVKGNYFGRSCAFYLGTSDVMIAEMSRKHTVSNVIRGKDTFCITVHPQVDYMFIAALVVILEEVHRQEQNQSSSVAFWSCGICFRLLRVIQMFLSARWMKLNGSSNKNWYIWRKNKVT